MSFPSLNYMFSNISPFINYCNTNFELATKARACKGAS